MEAGKMAKEEAQEFSELCDNCKREPEPFMASDTDGGRELESFYHVVDKQSGEGTVLMSNLEFAFALYPEKNHPVDPQKLYLCSECFFAGFDQEDDEYGESQSLS